MDLDFISFKFQLSSHRLVVASENKTTGAKVLKYYKNYNINDEDASIQVLEFEKII